ncbi:hypothetical protein QUA00_18970 [Microcoleus sp. T2B6]|uniref:hypothetical protein n=1 Tax=Microcoleus sp. T2B6 TaxID=3055424 RepID=UPI002FCF2432
MTSSDEVIQGAGFTVKSSKFDFFFGRVTSTPTNTRRSLDNLRDLRTLGIDEVSGGKEKLLEILAEGLNAPEVEGDRTINEYGANISRKVELRGGEKPGAIVVRYFYPEGDLDANPQVTSIVPLIYQ